MRIVLCNGTFDPFHVGHLRHFYQAKRFGDFLVVSVTEDEAVRREKPGRPLFTEEERVEVLKSIAIVDRVIVVKGVLDALWTVRPHIFVKGPDYVGNINPDHEKFCREHQIEIKFTEGPKWAASKVVHELRGS